MSYLFRVLIAGFMLTTSTAVFAVPMTGGIAWSSDGTSVSGDIIANTVSFDPAGPNAQVDSVTGEFADFFAVLDTGEFRDFNYGSPPFALWTATGSVDPTSTSLTFTQSRYASKDSSRSWSTVFPRCLTSTPSDSRGGFPDGFVPTRGTLSMVSLSASGKYNRSRPRSRSSRAA